MKAAHQHSSHEALKEGAVAWFRELRDKIHRSLEALEQSCDNTEYQPAQFEIKPWDRQDHDGSPLKNPGGGGEMGILREGRVFEKAGVNISTVYGIFSEDFRKAIPGAIESDGHFWASGLSLVIHPRSPHVPPIHMNTRMIVTSKGWFGGGIDLNPITPDQQDTEAFHSALKACCDHHDPTYYPKFKDWADEYFWLPHRNEHRGVGGIFYDYLDGGEPGADFAFTKDVGASFLDIYPALVRRHMNKSWTDEEREHQLIRRGRYAEFNLIYDRGTVFGLKTGGNPEAILMSLPPHAKWP